jgi:WXG100 family type VII secretion target
MAHRYDLAHMSRFVDELDAHIERLQGISETIRGSATATESGFAGTGGDSFAAAHTNWQQDTGKHLEYLRSLRQHVHTTSRNYTEAERLNREMFGFAR